MSLGLASSPHLLYDFSRKIFLVLYSINWLTDYSLTDWLYEPYLSNQAVLLQDQKVKTKI